MWKQAVFVMMIAAGGCSSSGQNGDGRGDVVLRMTGLEDFDGGRLRALLETPPAGGRIRDAVVSGGRVLLRWDDATCTECFGYGIAVTIDVDGDGRCTSADPVWWIFANLANDPSLDVVIDVPPAIAARDARTCSVFP